MSIRFIDGFDQFQGQAAQQLLSSLTSAGYTVSSGLAMADARNVGGYALELQVAAGTAGDSWSSRTNNVKQDLRAVTANSSGRMIAVGNNGAAVGSSDNITWLPVILGVSANMRDIEVAGSTWIAVGTGSTIMRSTDGKNFSVKSAPQPNMTLQSVDTNGAGIWLAVGANGAIGVIFISTDDGNTWNIVPGAGNKALNCVRYANGVWMIGGAGGALFTSLDGTTLVPRNSGTVNNIASVARSEQGHWLMAAGGDIRRSIDEGVNWAIAASAVMTTINSIDYADGKWMAVGSNGSIRMSEDEETWTAPALVGIGTTTLYCVHALHGTTSGWAVVGGLNLAVTPSSARTAVIYVSLAPPTRVTRTFTPIGTKFTVGFAHRSTARGRILSVADVLDMDWPAQIEMNDQVGNAITARNTWYYYELTIDKSALTATLYINDTLDLTCPLDAGVAALTSFNFTWIAENGAVTRIDDIYMVDQDVTAGAVLTDRVGPITIPLRMPDTDYGPNQWTGSAVGEHWPLVGLMPPTEESFIRSAVSGATDLFTSSTPLPDGAGTVDAPIIAVSVIALAKKGDIDNRQLALVVGAPGVTQKSYTDTVLSVVPEYSQAVFEKAPGDVAWDDTNTVATPFGVVVKP